MTISSPISRPGVEDVAVDEVAQEAHVLVILDRHEVDHLEVASVAEPVLGVVDEGVAAAHAGGEVAAGLAQDDDHAAGHVLAGVVAHPLDDGLGAAVPDGEPLAGPAPEEGFAAGRPVERHVAHDHVLGPRETGLRRRGDDQLAAGESLADVVVGVAPDAERDAPGQEGPEALAGAAGELEVDRVLAEPVLAVLPRDEVAEQGADRPVPIGDRQRSLDALLVLDARPCRPAGAPSRAARRARRAGARRSGSACRGAPWASRGWSGGRGASPSSGGSGRPRRAGRPGR